MLKRSSQTLGLWFLGWDLTLTALAWVSAYHLRFSAGLLPIIKAQPDFDLCIGNLPLVLVLAFLAYRHAGAYQIHRLRRFREEMVAVGKGVTLMLLLVMAITFCRQDPYESRATMFLFAGLTAAMIFSARRMTWNAIRYLRSRGFNQSHAIIVGSGRVARKTARALRHASWMGLRNIGFVEDQPSRWTSDLDVLGTTAELPTLVEKYNVGHVFIALPMNRYHEARRVFDTLSKVMVEVRLVADVPDLAGLTLTTTNLDGMPVIGLRESPHFGLNVVVKRAMDVTLAAVGLVVLSPFLAVVAALVKLNSPGPIFFGQERCGLNGRTFRMLKFRTMRVDAEADGPGWTTRDDPRVTKLGAVLRKTCIDELPQLWNVLRGDMSLVGPRPEQAEFVQKFRSTIPNYMARHCVKSGITGWAQVHGWRGNTSLRKRVQYDLYYITHWNPWLDLRILWLTLWKGIFHRNAY